MKMTELAEDYLRGAKARLIAAEDALNLEAF